MNFFITMEERENFVKYCFDNGFAIIPALDYLVNSYYIIDSLEHYHKYMSDCVGFYLIHDTYKLYPLEMDWFEKDNQKKYYIMQRYGGPAIDFFSPILAEKKYNEVGPGLISIYPFYYHYNEKINTSNELKECYLLLTSYLSKTCNKVKIGKRVYWIGKQSIAKAKEGALSFVDMDGFDWKTILK